MRIFILTESTFAVPPSIIHQKTLDIVMAGSGLTPINFYIVGEALPDYYLTQFKLLNNVFVINKNEAESLVRKDLNSVVVHFGSTLKGGKQMKHYFIPLTLPVVYHPKGYWNQFWSAYQFKKFIKTSTATFSGNEWIHQSLLKTNASLSSFIQAAYLPCAHLPEFEWTHLAQTKEILTKGTPYFLSFTPLDNFVDTLKAFSIFKKWQQTTMAIVFVFDTKMQCEQALRLLKGFKYIDAVFIHTVQQVEIEWIAATYAVLWGHDVDFDKTSFMEWAIHYDIPLLFDKNEKQPISWQAAGEVFTFSDKTVLSDHFKLYYKDEVYRQARARMGKEWLDLLLTQRLEKGFPKLPNELKG